MRFHYRRAYHAMVTGDHHPIAHASIFTLSDNCFETIGGCVLRLWAYDDWRRPKAWSTTTLDLIPMVTAKLDLSTRLRAADQVRLGRFRAAHITVPPEISILIA